MNRKKIIFDALLNIVSSSLSIAVLQLLVYPSVAKRIGGEAYGFMLTIYSVWITISSSLGNVLNNTRLLLDSEYKSKRLEGDFGIIFIILHILNAIVVFAMTFVYYKQFNALHLFLSVLIAFFIFGDNYLQVGFRIKLNYKSILIKNLLLATGYALGFGLFYLSGIWEFVFLIGYALSCVYCGIKTSLLKESLRKTELMPKTTNHVLSLSFSTIISNIVSYADKMVLYPLMGGHVVSVYFAATVLGKMAGMLIGPITSVVLSYISKWAKPKAEISSKLIVIGGICSFLGYFFVLLVSKPVIGLLYPQWVDEAAALLPITTAKVMMGILIGIINPFVLKFCNINWQMGITVIHAVVYYFFVLVLWHFHGLIGFCVGAAIGTAVHLAVLLILYYSISKKKLN